MILRSELFRCILKFRPPAKLLQLALMLSLAVVCLGQTGCVRRRLTLRTSPPGAQVFVDDQEVGTTPCSTAFIYYGTRKITFIKEGYKTQTIYQQFNAPWYQIPPLDFITENLLPNETRDERFVDQQMRPQEIPAESKLRQRAENLRASAATGQITPLVFATDATNSPAPADTLPNANLGQSSGAEKPLGFPGQGLPNGQPQYYVPGQSR